MLTLAELDKKAERASVDLENDIEDSAYALKRYPNASLAALYDLVPELDNAQLVKLAAKYANNHAKFESFGWYERPDNSHQWTIVYTHNRDSTLLYQSNAAYIDNILEPYCEFGNNIISADASHWACGWVAGYAIRVYDVSGQITPAFAVYAEIVRQLEDYPVLDESDYSERESEATFQNIKSCINSALWSTEYEHEIVESDTLTSAVYSWLSDNDSGCDFESRDDQGAWFENDRIIEALIALDYIITPERQAELDLHAHLYGTGDSGYTHTPLPLID